MRTVTREFNDYEVVETVWNYQKIHMKGADMQEVFSKIIEKLEVKRNIAEQLIMKNPHDEIDRIQTQTAEDFVSAYNDAIEVVKQEVEILLNSRICEKQKTNADRIRSMSDEELAGSRVDRIDFYTKSDISEYIGDFGGIANSIEEAIALEIKWLQSEVEE